MQYIGIAPDPRTVTVKLRFVTYLEIPNGKTTINNTAIPLDSDSSRRVLHAISLTSKAGYRSPFPNITLENFMYFVYIYHI